MKILFVEDVKHDAELNWREIEKNGIVFKKLLVDNRKDFLEGLESFKPDIIISDYSLPQFDGMQALLLRNELAPLTPFIIVTGSVNEEVAVECMKAGADDYVIKEHLTRLPFAIKEALEQHTILIEKRAAELLLKENEEKLQSIFSAAPVGIGLVVGRVFIEVNDTFCKMTGYSRKEMLGKNAEAIYAKDEQNESAGIVIFRHIAEKGTGSVETRFKCKDGRILNIFLSSTPLDKYDHTKGITFIAMDITEKKKAEEALHESRQLFQTLAQVSPVGIFRTNTDGYTTYLNPKYLELTGLIAEEAIGFGWINAVHPDDREILKRNWLSDIQSQKTSNAEYRFLKPDGSIVWVMGNAVPEWINDKIVGYIGTITDITEFKFAEEKLKSSEERFKILFDYAPDAYYLSDLKGNFIDGNIAAEKLLGHRRNELIGKNFLKLNLLSPKQLPGAAKLLVKNALGQSTGPDEFVLSQTDRSKVTVEILTHPVKIKDQTLVLGLARDISYRKLTEEKIILERRMLRTLIDNLPDHIYVKDSEGRKVISNISDFKDLGLQSEEQVIGKTDLELFPGQTGQRGYADDMEVITSGNAILAREEDFITSRGKSRWSLASKIPLMDTNGKITGLVGIGRDITERKRAEAKLLQSYTFNESLLKTIPFGMHIVDEEGTILFLSEKLKRLLGDEGLGRKCWEIYRDDKKQCSDCPLLKGITIGETEAYESHGVLGNRIFEISHTGMWYNGNKAMLEIFQDITDKKQSEVELINAKDKAEEGDRLKTAFLHNISHEIRTPMNAIVGFSTLLGEPDVDTQSRKDYIEVIIQSSNHLLSIISDIVDISNIEAGIVKIAKNEVNINNALKTICNQFTLKADEKNVNLVCETEVPDSDSLITTDSTKLTQIITNLVSNAIKFTDKGYIKLGCKLKNKFLEFQVSDTGIGISEEQHQKIFNRFYQVQHAVSRLYEGTGLGLAISKANVELMGGKIWLTSEPGKGASFYFTIPYEKQVAETPEVNGKRVPGEFFFPEKKRILVAEDVDSNFKLINYFFHGTNAEAIRAYNGKEAVKIFMSDKNIDLILMDIKMPVMDGYTAIKLIREINSTIPIIAQTAYIDDKEQAIEYGCSGFISKPFDKKGLLKVLQEFI